MKLTEMVLDIVKKEIKGETTKENLTKIFNEKIAIKDKGKKVIKYNMLELAQLQDKHIVEHDMFEEPEQFVNDLLLKYLLAQYE